MQSPDRRTVFFVDDEPSLRKQLARTLGSLDVDVVCFEEAAACLGRLQTDRCDLLVTDVKMPGMNGIELLVKARSLMPSLPVLLITGYGDVPMAVQALKAGALDFIEKPLKRDALLQAVKSALAKSPQIHIRIADVLTRTEREVLRMVVHGRNAREIAGIRHRSVRTIEDHRSRIFRKLGVSNLVELLNKLNLLRPEDLLEHL
ncbi:MAG TPA: response regulator transcription factor [Phycisphaerales bacterium]|nr:response regulator transcription factor [Phycisphaerales bacterium]